jgi:hypothetical protein
VSQNYCWAASYNSWHAFQVQQCLQTSEHCLQRSLSYQAFPESREEVQTHCKHIRPVFAALTTLHVSHPEPLSKSTFQAADTATSTWSDSYPLGIITFGAVALNVAEPGWCTSATAQASIAWGTCSACALAYIPNTAYTQFLFHNSSTSIGY